MRRYNIVSVILLILSIINFALAAPALIPEQKRRPVDVVHVPKDVITVLGKRGDEWEKMVQLSESFNRWWGGNRGTSSIIRPPSSSAPLETGHGSMQEHGPPANPVSSTESNRDPESLVLQKPTPNTASSSESSSAEYGSMPGLVSASDLDREAKGVDHAAPPPNPESLIASGHSHTLPSGPVASTVGTLDESSKAPATPASGGILPRGVDMTLPGLSDDP